jgi:hypothetical protein
MKNLLTLLLLIGISIEASASCDLKVDISEVNWLNLSAETSERIIDALESKGYIITYDGEGKDLIKFSEISKTGFHPGDRTMPKKGCLSGGRSRKQIQILEHQGISEQGYEYSFESGKFSGEILNNYSIVDSVLTESYATEFRCAMGARPSGNIEQKILAAFEKLKDCK